MYVPKHVKSRSSGWEPEKRASKVTLDLGKEAEDGLARSKGHYNLICGGSIVVPRG